MFSPIGSVKDELVGDVLRGTRVYSARSRKVRQLGSCPLYFVSRSFQSPPDYCLQHFHPTDNFYPVLQRIQGDITPFDKTLHKLHASSREYTKRGKYLQFLNCLICCQGLDRPSLKGSRTTIYNSQAVVHVPVMAPPYEI
ncbi:hypothetical protein M378DRAFT_408855 [Amanita muscaria Koide BX008]|uniref:Uncharacterized protein n=1 Tax=Amanita muscaria (strain Koide BX008) TaxID=946122 RepID=A0A0C2WWR0_AMAMK|nr:hypothetical protein M378DRAFT_408855 [Amanita muscaria Koide BX008]